MLTINGDGWSRTVEPGGELRFGRGGAGIDLVLDDDVRLHRHCGTIVAGPDWWELHNAGSWLCLRVASADRFAVDSLKPGESMRVPWATTKIRIHLTNRCFEFTVAAETATTDLPDREISEGEGPTANPVVVDRSAGYFRALVALCEPRLLDPTSDEVATDLQIALRLNRSGRESNRVTGKTVERRLDNCRARFHLKEMDESGASAGLERRDGRRRLVDLALLTGTVSVEDLRLLMPFPEPQGARTVRSEVS